MFDKDVDFKALVQRIETGEREYNAKIRGEGTELFREVQSLFVKSIDEDKRQIEAIVSTADVDRYDEIIEPEAFRELLPVYLKNPVVISSHQSRLDTGHSSVVGQVIKTWIDTEGLHVIVWFAETELGNEFWYLYKNKFQRAFSVGFIPKGDENRTLEDGHRVKVFTKVELLEISCVPVPANQNALSKSRQRKSDFVAEKKSARQQLEKDAEDYVILTFGEDEYDKLMTDSSLDALEPDAEYDELELSGEADLDFEPDYSSYF
jgi:HK97 family phage prohead protease